MRRLKLFRIARVSDDLRLVLEDWAGILFAIGVGLLLFATLKAQLARAAEFPTDVGAGTPPFQTADHAYEIISVSPRVPMDRDFLIAWRPSVGSSPAVAALPETRGDTTYENAHARRAQRQSV